MQEFDRFKKIDKKQQRILVVDDDPQSVVIVEKSLKYEGYQVDVANSGKSALEKVSSWQPHLVLLDVSMPGLNGLETLKNIRSQNDFISVIFVSGKSETEDVINGLDAGAGDYICKPFNPLELLARVRSQLRIKRLNDQLTAANKKLQELAETDDLTGLFNMRSLYSRLDYELERARRYGRSTCVIMMDMDYFKSVNDENDHLFGSFVLSEVGKIIKENIRKVDFAARYGGDEFLMVLTEVDLVGAQSFAERLRSTIENYKFTNDGYSKNLTSSLGLAVTPAGDEVNDARSLVRHADHALYKAKRLNRNCVFCNDLSKTS